MDTAEIVSYIDAEIAKLQQARTLLAGVATVSVKRGPGRPKAGLVVAQILSGQPRKRTLSAEARAKIAAAQKARWAASKKSAKKAVKAIPAKAVKVAALKSENGKSA